METERRLTHDFWENFGGRAPIHRTISRGKSIDCVKAHFSSPYSSRWLCYLGHQNFLRNRTPVSLMFSIDSFLLFLQQLKKTKANSLHVQKQYDHETRKKEREFTKLKERIHQLLTDKSQEKRVGLDILNLIKRPSGQRAMWKTETGK